MGHVVTIKQPFEFSAKSAPTKPLMQAGRKWDPEAPGSKFVRVEFVRMTVSHKRETLLCDMCDGRPNYESGQEAMIPTSSDWDALRAKGNCRDW
jgi:hypothetical protein